MAKSGLSRGQIKKLKKTDIRRNSYNRRVRLSNSKNFFNNTLLIDTTSLYITSINEGLPPTPEKLGGGPPKPWGEPPKYLG